MNNPTFGLPQPSLPWVDENRKIVDAWYKFIVRLAQLTPERPFDGLTVGASPYTYTASTIGHLLIHSGTVSAVSITRNGTTLVCPTSGFIPMAANDAVAITYSVLPTVTFVPSARA